MFHAELATTRSRSVPSWLISAIVHAVAILTLGLLVRPQARGTGEESIRAVGVVLKHATSQGEYYEGEDDLPRPAMHSATDSQADDLAQALPGEAAHLDPSDALPQPAAAIGAGALEEGGVADASDLLKGAGQPKSVAGRQASVGVYGLEADGHKFCFVFDRSTSMDGPPLASAKRELIKALRGLGDTHQFQVIFFNQETRIFDLTGGQRRVPFATERNKQLARDFIGGITAVGNTDRFAALNAGLKLRPDVLFFLTDADNPMTADEVEQIRRRNRGGTAVHVIEFGYGAPSGEQNFLVRIAEQNGGSYTYVDTSTLGQ